VNADDVIKCEEKYNKAKSVHSIMRHVAERSNTDLEKMMEMVAWPLYRKYGHAYEAFKLGITSVFCTLMISCDAGCFHLTLPTLVNQTYSEIWD
jgi:translation initiation factor 2 subunit 1